MTTITENASIPTTKPEIASRMRYITPAVAIYEDADGYTIEAEMPAVAKQSVHVTVENGELTLTGTKAAGPAGSVIHVETACAEYRRVFDVDPAVDIGKITARIDQGVLVVRLPKAQDKKPIRISVTS